MGTQPIRVERSNWAEVVAEFERFFSDRGALSITADEVSFDADNTGLTLHRDGSSRSFMPLHGLDARWDAVIFDHEAQEVTLLGESTRYLYCVPPNLRSDSA